MRNIETIREQAAFWEKDKAAKRKPINRQLELSGARVKLFKPARKFSQFETLDSEMTEKDAETKSHYPTNRMKTHYESQLGRNKRSWKIERLLPWIQN
jgi:hypothetical protein